MATQLNKILTIINSDTPMKNSYDLREEKGRQEARIEVTKNILTNGFSVKDISKITGLSELKIQSL